jgi:sugar lactone lactonase YvrE
MEPPALVPEVVIRASAETGEGPIWDYRTGELVWVDIPAGVLHRSDVAAGTDTAVGVGTMVGAVAPRAEADGWAAAVEDGFGFIDARGHLDLVDRAIPEPHLRMNDAACDARGRLWAGSLTRAFEAGAGRLHCWEAGQPSRVVLGGLTLPNGMGWNADGAQMYLADTKQAAVFGFEFDLDDAHLGERRVLIEVPAAQGMPDGLCVDADGCLWVAHWGGWRVCRYDPAGRLLRTVDFPVAQPSSCAFGPDTTMYVTTAWEGLPPGHDQPLAGSVFAFDAHVRGAPAGTFRA